MKIEKMFIRKLVCISTVALLAASVLTSFKPLVQQTDTDPLSTWDKDVLKQANSADTLKYLSGEEKKLVFYTNLCRLKPKLFYQTVVEDYIKKHPDQSNGGVNLKRQLYADKPQGLLVVDSELCSIAKAYARKMGEEGLVGHADFPQRMKPEMKRFTSVGENCSYGYNLAIDAFMTLLIDTSDPKDLGHRKNLLDVNFKKIGVALQPHKTYHWNFVMDFGG